MKRILLLSIIGLLAASCDQARTDPTVRYGRTWDPTSDQYEWLGSKFSEFAQGLQVAHKRVAIVPFVSRCEGRAVSMKTPLSILRGRLMEQGAFVVDAAEPYDFLVKGSVDMQRHVVDQRERKYELRYVVNISVIAPPRRVVKTENFRLVNHVTEADRPVDGK